MGGDLDGIKSSGPVHAEALARVAAVVQGHSGLDCLPEDFRGLRSRPE
jgi:hypothetical protein